MRLLFFLCFILFLENTTLFAQEQKKPSRDTTYIKDFAQALTVRGFAYIDRNSLLFKDPTTGKSIRFEPDNTSRIGFGGNFRRVGINLNFKFPFATPDDSKKSIGTTKEFTFQALLFTPKFGGDLFYRTFKGFYVATPNTFDPNYNSSAPYPFLEDMRMQEIGGDFYYITNNKRFSFRSLFVQDERQIKSAGTFLLGLTTQYIRISSERGFLPKTIAFNEGLDMRSFKASELGILLGYAYNLCIKKSFVFGFTFMQGLVGKKITIQYNQSNATKTDTGLAGFGRISFDASYSHKNYFFGLSLLSNQYVYRGEEAFMRNSMQLKLFGGFRLHKIFQKKHK